VRLRILELNVGGAYLAIAAAWLTAGLAFLYEHESLNGLRATRESYESGVPSAELASSTCCKANVASVGLEEMRSERVIGFGASLASELGVIASQMTDSTAATSSSELNGSEAVQAELSGSYSAIKTWLNELLVRYPGLGVKSLQLRRLDGSVQASVVLGLYRVSNP